MERRKKLESMIVRFDELIKKIEATNSKRQSVDKISDSIINQNKKVGNLIDQYSINAKQLKEITNELRKIEEGNLNKRFEYFDEKLDIVQNKVVEKLNDVESKNIAEQKRLKMISIFTIVLVIINIVINFIQ